MTKKRIAKMTGLLIFLLVASLLSFSVLAAGETNLTVYVNGVEMTGENNSETVSYSPATKTLTLTGATLGGEEMNHGGAGIYATGSDTLILELNGENTVSGVDSKEAGVFIPSAISVDGGLIIREGSANASLSAIGSRSGICAFKGLTIEGGNIAAVGGSGEEDVAIRTIGAINISGGNVTATGGRYGVVAQYLLDDYGLGDTTLGVTMPLEIASLLGGYPISISGGMLTATGSVQAVIGRLELSDDLQWQDEEDGTVYLTPNVTTRTSYLKIGSANYRFSPQPSLKNDYTAVVEKMTADGWDAAENNNHQWYLMERKPVVDQATYKSAEPGSVLLGKTDLLINDEDVSGTDSLLAYDSQRACWVTESTFAGLDNVFLGAMVLPAQAGDRVYLELEKGRGFLTVIPLLARGNSGFKYMQNTAVVSQKGNVSIYNVPEIEIESGEREEGYEVMYVLLSMAKEEFSFKVFVERDTEVETGAENANVFEYQSGGTYYGSAMIETEALLYTAPFSYDPVVAVAVKQINALPDQIAADDADTVEAARNAYDALTDDQKALVDEETLQKLEDAENVLATDAVETLINGLPDQITTDDADAIEAARDAYDALTGEQKELVGDETLQKLEDAEEAHEVLKLIEDLPEQITAADADAIKEAREVYAALTDDQKELIGDKTLQKLEDAEKTHEVLEVIDALPDQITADDADTVEAARNAYDALTDDQKALVDAETLQKLEDAEEQLKVLEGEGSDPDPNPNPNPNPRPEYPEKPNKPSKPAVSIKPEETPKVTFSDLVPGAWYETAINFALTENLMNGVGNGKFDPNGTTSRAMMVTILWRLEGSPAAAKSVGFGDVASGSWYGDAVNWAQSCGIVEGADGLFRPNDPVTREQLVTILFRYAVYKGMTTLTMEENLGGFPDEASISTYAISAMNWAVGRKIINGMDGLLNPSGFATRAQTAQMLMNYLSL